MARAGRENQSEKCPEQYTAIVLSKPRDFHMDFTSVVNGLAKSYSSRAVYKRTIIVLTLLVKEGHFPLQI